MTFIKLVTSISLISLILQGCATNYIDSMTRQSVKTLEYDRVRYMLNDVTAQGEPNQGVMVILGEKYTYELDDIYDDGKNLQNLNKIGKVLDLKYFKPEPIRFQVRY